MNNTRGLSTLVIVCFPSIIFFNLHLQLSAQTPTFIKTEQTKFLEFDTILNAGNIILDSRHICPGELQEIKVVGNSKTAHQYIFIADAKGSIIHARETDLWHFAFPSCGKFQVISYNCVDSTQTNTWIGRKIDELPNSICHLSFISIDVKNTTPPKFTYLPDDITVNCLLSPLPFSDGLPYVDQCGIKKLAPLINRSTDFCLPETSNRVWQINDGCGFELYHIQKITNKYGNHTPYFINPPANITVSCSRNDIIIPNLTIVNYAQFCNIDLSIAPKVESNPSPCGGTITAWWTYTDACNRTITHSLSITKTPMSLASFINPPSDITLSCGMKPVIDSLAYSNGSSECTLQGKVPPQIKGDPSKCEPLNITWQFTDECQRTITHQQSITWSTNQKKANNDKAYLHANDVKPQKKIPMAWK